MSRRWRVGLVTMAMIALTMGVVVPASAITFNYEQIGGFTFGTESSTEGPGTGIGFFGPVVATPPAGDQYSTIGWGNQPGPSFTTGTDPFTQSGDPIEVRRSALRLDTVNGTIAPGETKVISILTHANRRILLPFLTGVTIDTRLRLTDPAAGNALAKEDVQAVPITLTETANLLTEAECDPNTHIATTQPCSDYFIFPFGALADVPFTYQGVNYSLSFSLEPGPGTIFEVVDCADPDGPPSGTGACGRVRTAEMSTNQISITMTLNQLSDVPALQVRKTPDAGNFSQGAQATFTIIVTNLAATGTATNVALTDQLPGNGGLSWVSASATQGSCTIGAGGDPVNFLRCALGDIGPGGSVTVTVSSTTTTPAAACTSQPNPIALATADGGISAQDEGSLTCSPPANLRTVTQGGWGSKPAGNNPGMFLQNNFGALGGPVVIGDVAGTCGFSATFSSAAAIRAFLPQGGTPAALTADLVNPTAKITVFAGQVLALTLNVGFSNLGLLPPGLGTLVIPSGPATGRTVNQVLADANQALAGCGLPVYVTSISQLNDIVTAINEAFD